MYARVIYKDRKRPTASDVIDSDIKDFAAMDKDSAVSSMPSVRTRDEKEATVKHFYDAHNRNEEAVAYIDEPRVVIILALSSRIKEEYSRSLDAFRSLVHSYFLVKELVGSGGGTTRAFFGLEEAWHGCNHFWQAPVRDQSR